MKREQEDLKGFGKKVLKRHVIIKYKREHVVSKELEGEIWSIAKFL